MKLKVQTKLFLGSIGILLLTVVVVSFTAHYYLARGLEHAMGPEGFQEFQRFDKEQGNPFQRDMQTYFTLIALVGSTLAIIASFVFSKYLITPIKSVIDTTKKIAKGDYQTRVEVNTNDEVGELCKSVNKMAEGLEETERLRRELVTNVAHELATPLTNISGYLEAMQDGTITGENLTKNTLKLLQDETDRLALMVADVRALSSAENPKLNLNIKAYEVDKLIKKIIAKMKPKYEKKAIKLTSEIQNALPKILVDKDKFEQIMINLISNAISYTPKKGKIKIAVKKQKGNIQIAVEDNGIGIPKEDLPHIFERFYRTDKSRSRKTGGTGVGLTIAKELSEAHGGKTKVKSKEGEGSRFICEFLAQ